MGHGLARVLHLLQEDGADLGTLCGLLDHLTLPLPLLLPREECSLAVLQVVSGKKSRKSLLI